jgi:N-acetylmuramoyl-L-alanine amidase
MTGLSPARRLASARPVANSLRRLPRGLIIVAVLCLLAAAAGCEAGPTADDLRLLERGLARDSVRRPTAPTAPRPRLRSTGCTVQSYDAGEPGQSLRVVLELSEEVPLTWREHGREGGGSAFSLELEGVACGAGPGRATGSLYRRDDAGSVVRVEADADQAVTLVRLGLRPLFVLDVAPRTPVDTRLVVLDPGHGGTDRGVIGSAALDEASVALDVAERAARWLTRYDPSLRAVLTRSDDTTLPALARASRANALGAAAFVSIHVSPSTAGVATYVLDPQPEPGDAALSVEENGGELGAPLSVALGAPLVASRVDAARRLAEAVHNRVYRGARNVASGLANRGLHRGPLHVLVGAAMPAVAVELGALGDESDASRLADARVRDAMAEGIARGLVRYLAGP